jgi:hypothetical protein
MARTIVSNLNQHPGDRHLVMVTRRKFGYWLRDRIAELDPAIGTELSFSEGLLETWAVREAFLFFSLIVDPDRPTWRAWLAYKNSVTGEAYKAPNQNADAYLRLLASADEHISSATIAELASEKRSNQRGQGGSVIWDRAKRFLELQEEFEDQDGEDPLLFLNELFDPDLWIGGKGEAMNMGLAIEPGPGYNVTLKMSRFLRDIITQPSELSTVTIGTAAERADLEPRPEHPHQQTIPSPLGIPSVANPRPVG